MVDAVGQVRFFQLSGESPKGIQSCYPCFVEILQALCNLCLEICDTKSWAKGAYIQGFRDIFMEELLFELVGDIDADKVQVLGTLALPSGFHTS